METPPIPSAPQKKGLGPLAWIGIGCGGIIVVGIVALVVAYLVLGPKAKEFLQNAQKDPTRATANLMVSMGNGQFEMVQQDEANKRYTIREKRTGRLTTVYWSEKAQAPQTVEGDFSAIPAGVQTSTPPATPAPATPEPAPAIPEPAAEPK